MRVEGASVYWWSRLEKSNTVVLHPDKVSELGSFLFGTALKNGLGTHLMTVPRYTRRCIWRNSCRGFLRRSSTPLG